MPPQAVGKSASTIAPRLPMAGARPPAPADREKVKTANARIALRRRQAPARPSHEANPAIEKIMVAAPAAEVCG